MSLNENGHGRRKINFDPTINLGHLVSASVFLITAGMGWANLSARVDQQQTDVKRVETQATEKIKNAENSLERFSLNYREDLRDVKIQLQRIEEKLDKKTDKVPMR